MMTLRNAEDAVRKRNQMVSNIVFGVYLLIVGAFDLLTSSIHLLLLAAGVVPIFLSLFTEGTITLPERGLGLATGLAVLLISLLSHEQIGKGDALLLCITGIYLGVYDNALLMTLSFGMVICYSIVILASRRFVKSMRIPYAPFVFVGYVVMMVGR